MIGISEVLFLYEYIFQYIIYGRECKPASAHAVGGSSYMKCISGAFWFVINPEWQLDHSDFNSEI